MQISIEYPSTWEITQDEDGVSLNPPVGWFNGLQVIREPIFPSETPEDYARENLNERRPIEIIEFEETTVNEQPAYKARYNSSNDYIITLSHFLETDDYTGYHLHYSGHNDEFARILPIIEKMVNSFRIAR
jgi:hypothetical protein